LSVGDVFAFRGKLEGKLAGTLGVFLYLGAELSQGALQALTWGKVVFDTGTKDKRRISALLEEIQVPLIKGFVLDRVALISVVPSIERWVLADTEALERAVGRPLPEELVRKQGRPEDTLRELFGDWGPKEQRRVARHLDPERIRARDASFEAFARALQSALGGRAPPLSEEREPAVP
jgi:hypothetical protein